MLASILGFSPMDVRMDLDKAMLKIKCSTPQERIKRCYDDSRKYGRSPRNLVEEALT